MWRLVDVAGLDFEHSPIQGFRYIDNFRCDASSFNHNNYHSQYHSTTGKTIHLMQQLPCPRPFWSLNYNKYYEGNSMDASLIDLNAELFIQPIVAFNTVQALMSIECFQSHIGADAQRPQRKKNLRHIFLHCSILHLKSRKCYNEEIYAADLFSVYEQCFF